MRNIDWLEINDQNGFMYADGTAKNEPCEAEIVKAVKRCGYIAYNVGISHDGLQQTWRFNSKIKATK